MGASDGFLRTYKGLSNSSSDNSTAGDSKDLSHMVAMESLKYLRKTPHDPRSNQPGLIHLIVFIFKLVYNYSCCPSPAHGKIQQKFEPLPPTICTTDMSILP
jgi:hypothetical protein